MVRSAGGGTCRASSTYQTEKDTVEKITRGEDGVQRSPSESAEPEWSTATAKLVFLIDVTDAVTVTSLAGVSSSDTVNEIR